MICGGEGREGDDLCSCTTSLKRRLITKREYYCRPVYLPSCDLIKLKMVYKDENDGQEKEEEDFIYS